MLKTLGFCMVLRSATVVVARVWEEVVSYGWLDEKIELHTVLEPAMKTEPEAPWMSCMVKWIGMPCSTFSSYFLRSEYAKDELAVPSSC